MTGKGCRQKGFAFERKVAKLLEEIYGEKVRRGIQSQHHKNETPPDVDFTPFYIECKKMKRPNVKAALLQAEKNTDGRPCLAITCEDRQPAIASMRLDDFLKILARLEQYEFPEILLEESDDATP